MRRVLYWFCIGLTVLFALGWLVCISLSVRQFWHAEYMVASGLASLAAGHMPLAFISYMLSQFAYYEA